LSARPLARRRGFWISGRNSHERKLREVTRDHYRENNSNPRTTVDETGVVRSMSLAQSPSVMYENMSGFLDELDNICSNI
jgi:hypothetical protein